MPTLEPAQPLVLSRSSRRYLPTSNTPPGAAPAPTLAAAFAVLRALAASSTHDSLRPLAHLTRTVEASPRGRCRQPAPANLNSHFRFIAALSTEGTSSDDPYFWSYFDPAPKLQPSQRVEHEIYFSPAVVLGLLRPYTPTIEESAVNPQAWHPRPDVGVLATLMQKMRLGEPWQAQMGHDVLGTADCLIDDHTVLWVTPATLRGRPTVPVPSAPGARPTILALVVNNHAAQDADLIDMQWSARLTGGDCSEILNEVRAYVLDWVSVLFTPPGHEGRVPTGSHQVRRGRPPGAKNRPKDADPRQVTPSTPATPAQAPSALQESLLEALHELRRARRRLDTLTANVQRLAAELAAADLTDAAQAVLMVLEGLDSPDTP